jgi:hypothetical protein
MPYQMPFYIFWQVLPFISYFLHPVFTKCQLAIIVCFLNYPDRHGFGNGNNFHVPGNFFVKAGYVLTDTHLYKLEIFAAKSKVIKIRTGSPDSDCALEEEVL